jgi:hypothetical protein
MKKVLLTLAALFVAISLASCGGGAPAGPVKVEGDSPAAIAANLNAQLAVLPPVDSFGYNSSRVSLGKIMMVKDTLVGVQKGIPEGYVLQITGHTDKYEKKSSVGLRRAKAVMYELRGYKMSFEDAKTKKKNVVAKNGYDKMMVKDVNGGMPEQRRVTFKVVKK